MILVSKRKYDKLNDAYAREITMRLELEKEYKTLENKNYEFLEELNKREKFYEKQLNLRETMNKELSASVADKTKKIASLETNLKKKEKLLSETKEKLRKANSAKGGITRAYQNLKKKLEDGKIYKVKKIRACRAIPQKVNSTRPQNSSVQRELKEIDEVRND